MEHLVHIIHGNDIQFEDMGVDGDLAEIASPIHKLSKTMGGGICRMKKSAFEWQLHYDEAIYVISGNMYIGYEGEKIQAVAGDIYFMKDGAKITYGTDEEVEFFFSMYPVNWKELQQ
ncbi:MAG: cupin domain-containing protein [Alicyclobacillaceae bacterium]|nr:cupin domain-containing protein [Alicyclobacillaceae bacterium]